MNLTDQEYLVKIRNQLYTILLENFYPRSLINKYWYSNYMNFKEKIANIVNCPISGVVSPITINLNVIPESSVLPKKHQIVKPSLDQNNPY